MKVPKGEKYLFYMFIFLFICLLGSFLNMNTVVNNDCKMPVKIGYVSSKWHFAYSDFSEVENPYLTDIIRVPFGVISIGDILNCVGFIGVVVNVFKYTKFDWRRKKW